MHHPVPLRLLHAGQVGDVVSVIGAAEHVCRFEELGLRSGTRVEIIRGGSPCIVRIAGSKFCLRDDEQVRILVAPRKTA